MIVRAAAVSLAVVGLLASGCSNGDAKPRSLPTLSPSPSPSGTGAAEVPIAARGATSLALDAFVRFYFAQLNLAFSTSDARIVRRYSDPACGTCNNYAKALDASGNHLIRGDTFAHVDVAAPPVVLSGTLVEVTGLTPARDVVDQSGNLLNRLAPDGPFHLQVNVIRTQAGWLVRGIRSAQR